MKTHTKKCRGAPRKNGIKSPLAFVRAANAIYWFNEARRRGFKYEAAVAFAARKTLSSTAEIKRIRAEFQSTGCELGLTVGTPRSLSPEDVQLFKALGLPEGLWNNSSLKVLPFGSGPIPRHPRVNARRK